MTDGTAARASTRAKLPAYLDDAVDDAVIIEAFEILGELATALFPDADVDPSLLSWSEKSSHEMETASLEDRLKAAEARFVTLVEQIPAVTFMAVLGDGENDIYVSPHIEQMLGYSQSEWLSDPFLWYYRLHPDDRAMWNQEFTRGIRAGGPFRAECRFLARNGDTVWVHGEARVVKDDRGRPQFLQGVAFDITESKKAQALLLENAVREAKHAEELAIARRVQTSLLPSDPALDGLRIAAKMQPADDVGGDYYDVRAADDGGWILIGDVSGHGLDAGLVMMMVQSAACAILTARPSIGPSELLSLVNEVLYDGVAHRLGRHEYVTLSVLRYRRGGDVAFAGAHQDILVRRSRTGRVERLVTSGPWVGIRRDIRDLTRDGTFVLEEGDVFVVFTDGITEAMNVDGAQFDIDRLCAAIEGVPAGDPPQAIVDHVFAKVGAFSRVQDDDRTLLVARYGR